jgi:hypothetical protein
MDAHARWQGLMLRCAAAYGDAGNPRFAAIWAPDTDTTLWNNDGISDSVGDYQARFNAETSAWCRPAFVTLNGSNQFLSLFVDREIGPWVALHNLSPGDYQTAFNTWTGKNYFPICVQTAGSSAQTARFAALFTQSEATTPKQFNAVGPVTNGGIDAIIQKAMSDSPVRHASIAIVNGTRLVYRAASLVTAQPADEARYQSPGLSLGRSQVTPDQRLVPVEYGTEQIEIMEGGGGLSGASTAVARLIAAMIDMKDTPTMSRKTLTSMVSAGAGLTAAVLERAGYGFDALVDQGGGNFYAQRWKEVDSSETSGDLGRGFGLPSPLPRTRLQTLARPSASHRW